MATRRRKWFQFSLRGLIVALTIGCVWLGWQVEGARRQRKAIAAIELLGGGTKYKWEVSPNDGLRRVGVRPDCPLPTWLRTLLSDDFLFNVTTVGLGPKATDDDVEWLNCFSGNRLLALDLGSKGITDNGLERVPPMPNLLFLGIDNSQITDKGIGYLGKFPRLRYLQMKHVAISDAGLLHLSKNKDLKLVLGISFKGFTEAGVAQFEKKLPNCKLSPF